MKGDTTCRGSTTLGTQSLGAPSHPSLLNPICLKNIDDLPENVLVEILCRLPCKFVARCKCVCKSWSTLISLPYFQTRRALYLNYNNCDDTDQILLSVETTRFGRQAGELFIISKHTDRPVLKLIKIYPSSPIVEATYNDLILFCEERGFAKKYFICNPYTNQWFAVPPSNCDSYKTDVGFICDSDYRCRIVRLLNWIRAEQPPFRLKVEVFSSETGKWTVSVVSFPQTFRLHSFKRSTPALAYDGMLYWLGNDGLLIGLDPFSKIDNNHHCRFISKPLLDFSEFRTDRECLGVCRGTVRLCRSYSPTCYRLNLCVWELKEEEEEEEDDSEVDGVGGKMMKWYLKERVELHGTSLGQLLALDPNDGDIIYLKRNTWTGGGAAKIVRCNIRTRKVIDMPQKLPCSDFVIEAFPFVPPCWQWPTPVPSLDSQTN